MPTSTVAIADDHPLVLQAVRAVLSTAPELRIVHACGTGTDLLERLALEPTDIVITDFSMSRDDRAIDGLALIKRLRRVVPAARLVLLTAHTHASVLTCALDAAVHAIVSKEDGLDELLRACRSMRDAGHAYCSPTMLALLQENGGLAPTKSVALTAKEAEVMRLVAAGHSLLEISARLSRSVSTISSQKHTAMRKLNLKTSADLIRYAYETGLL